MEMTGQKTVPNVFINKTHVGGWDKTKQVGAPPGLGIIRRLFRRQPRGLLQVVLRAPVPSPPSLA